MEARTTKSLDGHIRIIVGIFVVRMHYIYIILFFRKIGSLFKRIIILEPKLYKERVESSKLTM
jgi:hypothetical protein